MLSNPAALAWNKASATTKADINTIFSLISPQLHWDAKRSIRYLKEAYPDHPGVQLWPSTFSGINVIINKKTPSHRDKSGRPEWYDWLFATGTYRSAMFDLLDLGARLSYNPGTVVAAIGRVLQHEVKEWEDGERICKAHYMRNNVLNRQGIQNSPWVEDKIYKEWMSPRYLQRQKAVGL
jgi:hypothetical protein